MGVTAHGGTITKKKNLNQKTKECKVCLFVCVSMIVEKEVMNDARHDR